MLILKAEVPQYPRTAGQGRLSTVVLATVLDDTGETLNLVVLDADTGAAWRSQRARGSRSLPVATSALRHRSGTATRIAFRSSAWPTLRRCPDASETQQAQMAVPRAGHFSVSRGAARCSTGLHLLTQMGTRRF